jgi:hypothetical protein
MPDRIKKEQFFEKVAKNFGDRLDFSKSNYICQRALITAICYKHGEITKPAKEFYKGFGCRYCGYEKIGHPLRTKAQFILDARMVHGFKYDYSRAVYVNDKTKLEIHCPIHGGFFQSPMAHLDGCGCPDCRRESNKKLIHGVGINDSPVPVKVKGVKMLSFSYWELMIKRLYSRNSVINEPVYRNVKLTPEWTRFSNFKAWFDLKYKPCDIKLELDKDLMCHHFGLKEKIYSPNTCEFLPKEVNNAIAQIRSFNALPIGVCYDAADNKYYGITKAGGKVYRTRKFDTPEKLLSHIKNIENIGFIL